VAWHVPCFPLVPATLHFFPTLITEGSHVPVLLQKGFLAQTFADPAGLVPHGFLSATNVQ